MPSSLKVRPFHRDDRDQVTELVNAHVAAVVPGLSVSVNTVLSQLQRRPQEFILDPWVAERVTLVAEQRQHVVAAAHLLRYRADAATGADYRNAGVIEWFVFRPPASFWPDSERAADLLMAACLAQLTRWDVSRRHADGQLPAPGICGVPDQWEHIRASYRRAGFTPTGPTEVLLIAPVADLRRSAGAAVPGSDIHRTLGECGTRFSARLGDEVIGYVEVDTSLDRPERYARNGGLADLAGLHVTEPYQGSGLEEQLLAHAAQWLQLAGVDRLLAYATADDIEETEQLGRHGFQELSRMERGWEHRAVR
ncbi:GNAT family N-acetyltransferase [Streptomyces sp. ML-6]|uniref:GNAT family N-acetyltransferase n=1 Tax=unclassified Streptomyces TaxID=2593676 RepID=UPI0024BF8AAD|nr:GNAT family N-acetyltransferase [Streptomyces sp. ML-6]MDK0524126.1 GNAT family N-acetyltransferase [Streptomyces sp. ML-6]